GDIQPFLAIAKRLQAFHSHSLSDADFLNNEEVNGVAISRKKWNTTWFVIV
ncbi:hypothetical protein S245_040303, partial [Arachis hypogaea]